MTALALRHPDFEPLLNTDTLPLDETGQATGAMSCSLLFCTDPTAGPTA